MNKESRRTAYHDAILAQVHDTVRQAKIKVHREPRGLLLASGLTSAGRARLDAARHAASTAADAHAATTAADAAAGDDDGGLEGQEPGHDPTDDPTEDPPHEDPQNPQRGAYRPPPLFEQYVRKVTPDLAVEIDKVTRILDVKTLSWSPASGNYYRYAASKQRCSAPVDRRAEAVGREYLGHARKIDSQINRDSAGDAGGSMVRSLLSLGGCVGLVFGQFSEASKDVTTLLKDTAASLAEERWMSMRCPGPDEAAALLRNELHKEWGSVAAKYRARYLLSGIKFANGTWKATKQALSFRLESDARRLVDRAVLATLTNHLRCDD
jgi:hypothetical protein